MAILSRLTAWSAARQARFAPAQLLLAEPRRLQACWPPPMEEVEALRAIAPLAGIGTNHIELPNRGGYGRRKKSLSRHNTRARP